MQGPEAARSLVNFLNASPTPFHAVAQGISRLEAAGFQRLLEKDPWSLKAGAKYYFSRNQAALVAFQLPSNWNSTSGHGVSIVATHVDSPNLHMRPVSKRTREKYLQVGVELYGGGIWHSWLDRDLSIAGRVVTSTPDGFKSRLVKIDKPLLRIPTLAIHLDRNVNDSFKFNQETEFVPILGLISAQLNETAPASSTASAPKASSIQENHHPALLALLADELSIAPENILDFELSLYDVQPSTLGGLNNEFVFSARIDNLFSSFAALEALTQNASATSASGFEGNVAAIALFNHEEIGSVSSSGADSSLIPLLINRLSPQPDAYAQSIAKSFLISADMGHAVHPNYSGKHEDNHKPRMNGGVVIKTNAKQRYASDAVTTFVVKQLIERKGGKVQEFEVRNDMACGSTVGPMLSKLGVRTCDVGCAMLSMHSIRETAGSDDVQNYIDLFRSLFESYELLEKKLHVD
ncbi:hypothetical protein MKEN_00064100 [Mycena kentingensis (nom. inval.)]|nr:hypothetical protein MKEN_00064100 [Mycena kentingensis (nom. inval.)]